MPVFVVMNVSYVSGFYHRYHPSTQMQPILKFATFTNEFSQNNKYLMLKCILSRILNKVLNKY